MIQTRPCWGGASRAKEAGRTGFLPLCWDLSPSGTKPAMSCSTDMIWTQIHVLDIALFNRSATALQHDINHLSWLSVGLLINSRVSAKVVSSQLSRAVRRPMLGSSKTRSAPYISFWSRVHPCYLFFFAGIHSTSMESARSNLPTSVLYFLSSPRARCHPRIVADRPSDAAASHGTCRACEP
jgi:hypothetical protein